MTLVGATAMPCQVSMTSLDLRGDVGERRLVRGPITSTHAQEQTFPLPQGTTEVMRPLQG